MRKTLSIGACAAVVAGFSFNASAQLYVYEPFDYSAGANLDGQSGGVGFAGAWNGATTAGGTIVAGSLSAGGIATIGNSAVLSGELGTYNVFRSFSNIAGGDGTTTWYSYVGQRLGAAQDPATTSPPNMYPRGVNIGLFDTEVTANPSRAERLALGNSSNAPENEWSIIPEGSGSVRVGSAVPYTDLYWAVVRIDHHGDATVADDAYLFLNPNPGIEPALGTALASAVGVLDYSNLDYLRPFIGNESSGRPFGVLAVDEIRLGGDYASMSAVPEPTTISLLALAGGLGLFLRRRRS